MERARTAWVWGIALFGLTACSSLAVDLAGRPCDAGACLAGYECDPATDICVPEGQASGSNECTAQATRACYSHGDGLSDPTIGVGTCRSGTTTCDDYDFDEFTEWGPCTGEVVPAGQEICGNNQDDDCNGDEDDGCSCATGQTRPCYEGPANSEDVGICTGGDQACDDGVWGACLAQVLPAPEVCNGLDDDCNGAEDDSPAPASALPCPDVGVCSLGTPACAGESGWVCNHPDFEDPETKCDGLDNDCNGIVDDGPDCIACNDGIDNDGDLAVDYPDDPGCDDLLDDDESNEIEPETCSDIETRTVGPTGIVSGSTQTEGDTYGGSGCGSGGDGANDVVYAIPMPAGAESLYVSTYFPGTEFNSLVSLRDGCAPDSDEITCGGSASYDTGGYFRSPPLSPGTYFVVIDGQAAAAKGSYEGFIQAQVAEGWLCDPATGDWGCVPDLDCLDTGSNVHRCAPAACTILGTHHGSFTVTGTTVGAPALFLGSCEGSGSESGGPEVVYVLSLDDPVTTLVLDLSGVESTTDFDTVMYVRESCHGAPIACNDDAGGYLLASKITLYGVEPGDYYIFVDGWGREAGNFTLTVTAYP